MSAPVIMGPTTTRTAILDAAERRFAERGFDGVSVREIAADVGLKNQASLYYHFANKQEIYEAALQRSVTSIIERLADGADATPGRRDTATVARDLDRVLDYLIDHPDVARIIQRAGLDESALVRGAAQRAVQPLYALGVRLLKDAGGPWHADELPHVAAGLYHLIFGYFADAALLEGVLQEDLRSPAALARQRQFLRRAVARLIGVEQRDEGEHAMTTDTLVDLYSPSTYEHSMPHEAFTTLRRERPVIWQPEPGGKGYWAFTRYEDIVTISSDNTLFSSERGGTNIEDQPEEGMALLRTILINMDPPKHTKYRKLVATGFTPKIVSQTEPHVREITKRIVDGVIAKGSCDFVTDIAAKLPLAVICEMLGVPDEDHDKVFDWSNRLIGFDDAEYHTSPEDGRVAATDMFVYAHGLAAERKARPKADIISILMGTEVDGDVLSEADFDGFFILLAVAGNETTRNLISGAMLALIECPEQRARLIADPALMTTAIEEFLRWVSPLIYFRRTLARDAVVGGQQLREGDKVAIYYPSGNRDEAIFENGQVFDVGRSPNPHMAFGGGGPHFCLGASLARLEIRCMFEELLTRMPDIELDGPVQRLRSNFINGIKHMPVRYTPS